MAAKWCSICNAFHEPCASYVCHGKQAGRGTGPFAHPRVGAALTGAFYGIIATLAVGWLTNGDPLSLIVFALVAPLGIWWKWPKGAKRPAVLSAEGDPHESDRVPEVSASMPKRNRSRLWRWLRRGLLFVGALPILVGVGFVLYDVDLLRYPARYSSFGGRYFGFLTDPFGYHPQKTTARLLRTSWESVAVDEIKKGDVWKVVRSVSARGDGPIVLAGPTPAERNPACTSQPTRRRRYYGRARFHISARGFEKPIVLHRITLLREADRQWHTLYFPNLLKPADAFHRSYSKELLALLTQALRSPTKAYVQARPWPNVEVFVDNATFAKIVKLTAKRGR